MLYTLFVLCTGVYLGQEFTVIPSVKVAILNLLVYLKNNETIRDTNTTNDIAHNTDGTLNEIVKWLKERFKC